MYNATKSESEKEVQLFVQWRTKLCAPTKLVGAIRSLMEGKDGLINMLTGSGKSICYALMPWAV